jgi:hypothetical protein
MIIVVESSFKWRKGKWIINFVIFSKVYLVDVICTMVNNLFQIEVSNKR